MAMKDSSNVVKGYAMVNVSNYNIVATDNADGKPDLALCIENYTKQLKDNKNVSIDVDTSVDIDVVPDDSTEDKAENVSVVGAIVKIKSQIENGSTCYYIAISGLDKYVRVSADELPEAIFYEAGDILQVSYTVSDVNGMWIDNAKVSFAETTTE